MLCAAAGSICLSDYLFVLFAGVCIVQCVIVLCGVMVDVLVAYVVIWSLTSIGSAVDWCRVVAPPVRGGSAI